MKTFGGTERRAFPRLLAQLLKSPFFSMLNEIALLAVCRCSFLLPDPQKEWVEHLYWGVGVQLEGFCRDYVWSCSLSIFQELKSVLDPLFIC